jgi:hypothetical protein
MQDSQRPDALARTLFVLAMLGVVAFGGAVLMLLTLSRG